MQFRQGCFQLCLRAMVDGRPDAEYFLSNGCDVLKSTLMVDKMVLGSTQGLSINSLVPEPIVQWWVFFWTLNSFHLLVSQKQHNSTPVLFVDLLPFERHEAVGARLDAKLFNFCTGIKSLRMNPHYVPLKVDCRFLQHPSWSNQQSHGIHRSMSSDVLQPHWRSSSFSSTKQKEIPSLPYWDRRKTLKRTSCPHWAFPTQRRVCSAVTEINLLAHPVLVDRGFLSYQDP